MRRTTVIAVAATALLVGLLIALPAIGAPPTNPLIGAWETFDPGPDDTSHIRLQISPTGTFNLRDEAASGCDGASFGFVAATVRGTGLFDLASDPATFVGSGDLYCYPRDGRGRTLFAPDLAIAVQYDADDDVLIGTAGQLTCWSRVGSGDQSDCP